MADNTSEIAEQLRYATRDNVWSIASDAAEHIERLEPENAILRTQRDAYAEEIGRLRLRVDAGKATTLRLAHIHRDTDLSPILNALNGDPD